MQPIDLRNFRGEVPKTAVRKIPTEASAHAVNVRMSSGDLKSWQAPERVTNISLRSGLVRSVFLYENEHWFSWTTKVSAIKSPIAQDDYARIYFTGDGVPKVTSNLIATGGDPKPVAAYDLGVPPPEDIISVSVSPDSEADPADFSDDETRYYVMTYVTEYGEEGPSSLPSLAVDLLSPSTDVVTLTLPIPRSNTQNITKKRIYVSQKKGSDTGYFKVVDLPIATTEWVDDVKGGQLGGPLVTTTFDIPPANMQGLVMGENGIAAGFAGNEFIISEAYQPYAYPVGYRHAVDDEVVAIAPTSTGFVVATKGIPHAFSGVSPASLAGRKLGAKQACVSGASLVDMGEFAIYASPDGLVAAGESSAEVITLDLFNKEEWEVFKPETIHAYFYEGYYIGFYGDTDGLGSGEGGFIYHPGSSDFVKLDFYATAGHNDMQRDVLYLVIKNKLYAWNSGSIAMAFTWRSKIFQGKSTAYTCAKVYTEDPANVGFKMWVDGDLKMTVPNLLSEAFRLPPVRGSQWQFELTGSAAVQRLVVDYAMGDLE